MSIATLIAGKGTDVTVARPVFAQDAGGHPTPTYSSIGTERGFVQPRSGAEALRYGRENSETLHVIYFETDADIQPEDKLLIGSRVLRVENVRRPGELGAAEFTSHLVVTAIERKGET